MTGLGVKGNLAISANQPLTFTYDLASPTPPILSIRKAGPEVSSRHRSRTLFSFSTFLNLFMLWLLVSMGQQVQRLRNEVAFVADEARDLRLYSMGMTSPAPDDHPTSPEKPIISQDDGSSTAMVEIGDKMSTAVGRVVFGASSWETWIQHRT